jgi:hypothetical protein
MSGSTTYLADEHAGAVRSPASPVTSRAWARTGVLAGIAGIASIVTSLQIDVSYDPAVSGDADAIVARLAELRPQIIAFHLTTAVAALLIVVFAAGLHRRLAAQLPPGSLLPAVAAGGLGLVSVAGLLGSGLDTEFLFAPDTASVPESAAFYGHWVSTIPWLWTGAGLTGIVLAVAALRHAAAPRWTGWVSVVLGGLTLLAGISPLQYMAGFVGPVWLLVVALGFSFGDRARP